MLSESSTFSVSSAAIPRAADRPVAQAISRRELALAGMTSLVIYTALLIRMPYRPALMNILYAGGALASFYGYLRWRLRIRLPVLLLAGLAFGAFLDILGNRLNLFSRTFGFLPYDVITHFTTTALSLVAVMWLLIALIKRYGYRLPLGWVAFFSVTTTFSLSAYYEILELWDEQFLGGHRIWSTHDTDHDLASNLSGAIIAAIFYLMAVRNRWRFDQSAQDQGS